MRITREHRERAVTHARDQWAVTRRAYVDAGCPDDAPLGAHVWSARRSGLTWTDCADALGVTAYRARKEHEAQLAYFRGGRGHREMRAVGLAGRPASTQRGGGPRTDGAVRGAATATATGATAPIPTAIRPRPTPAGATDAPDRRPRPATATDRGYGFDPEAVDVA